ncbi:uncharacterized protein LOC106674239 [Cimex lectularius]|uniref:Uncharacterized protein n=1 Tax=Cimex lectularius TaxID=79782 RepID=A0A8I6SJ20_CIMLE|nr:uncharacterized protein LOC106674239 [Cimex lectularius]
MEVMCERRNPFTFLMVSTAVHTFGFLILSIALFLRLYHEINKPKQDYFTKFAYSFKYLNSLNALMQSIYHLIALTVDIMISCSYTMDAPPGCVEVRAFIRSAFAIPIGTFNCIAYWALSLKSADLLVKSEYPLWLRHTLYTMVPIILFFDVISCKGDSVNVIIAMCMLGISSFLFLIWLHLIYHFTGVWAISFLKNLTLPQKLASYVFFVLVEYAFFLVGKLFNDLLWDEEFVSGLPFLRKYVSVPPRFIFGKPSVNSAKLKRLLSRTGSMFVDRPKKTNKGNKI